MTKEIELEDIILDNYSFEQLSNLLYRIGRKLQEQSLNFTLLPVNQLELLATASNHITLAASKLERL